MPSPFPAANRPALTRSFSSFILRAALFSSSLADAESGAEGEAITLRSQLAQAREEVGQLRRQEADTAARNAELQKAVSEASDIQAGRKNVEVVVFCLFVFACVRTHPQAMIVGACAAAGPEGRVGEAGGGVD